MSGTQAVEIALTRDARRVGTLKISLPYREGGQRRVPLILDLRGAPDRDTSLEPIQLLESQNYVYDIELDNPVATLRVEPEEVFDPDTARGRHGRLAPKLQVGILLVRIQLDGEQLDEIRLEVRARKLDYLRHYRWMLRDLADLASGIVMQRFAATQQRFAVDPSADPDTLYQQFAFLDGLLRDGRFESAMALALGRPHRAFVETTELRRPGQRIPSSSSVARQIAGPGARVRGRSPAAPVALRLVPRELRVQQRHETFDTPPNRFLKFALRRWRGVVQEIHDALAAKRRPSRTVARGQRQTAHTLGLLDSYLAATLFVDVGPMETFPAGDQVLQKREGYRDLLRSYVQFEAASRLTWEGGDDVFGAGQRDVATLYEYWVFLQMAQIIGVICGERADLRDLVEVRGDRLALCLKRGRALAVSAKVERFGRLLNIDLWFNRSFTARTDERRTGASWSRVMRPDVSLRIRAEADSSFLHREVWLHFDAKYRVDRISELFGSRPATEHQERDELRRQRTADREGKVLRADLLKMHAYRDAIRRSAGAYVIYPGTQDERLREFHELLPGLGAFPLRPSSDGGGEGSNSIRRFVEDAIDHFAHQATQHERSQYWLDRSFSKAPQRISSREAFPFLVKPPEDTRVLIGYVRSTAQLNWILRNRRYNLRADGRRGSVGISFEGLDSEFLLLYGRQLRGLTLWRIGGDAELWSKPDLQETGYPSPGGDQYLCISLGEEISVVEWGQADWRTVAAILETKEPGQSLGQPAFLAWGELVQALGPTSGEHS